MATTLVSVYDRLPAADRARSELLACGFAADHVHLVAKEDEAGAMKGNFSVGNIDPNKNNDTYARDYANPQQHAEILLTVDAEGEQQSQQALDILQRCGALRVDQGSGVTRA